MLLWMAAVFAFSSRSGDESSRDSYFAGTVIGKIFVPGFDEWSEEQKQEFAEQTDHVVRKSAHAAEYAILGLLAAGAFIGKRTTISGGIFQPWIITTAYAATDEFHQLFVQGRSGQISDVVLDSAGALAGLAALAMIRRLLRFRSSDVAGEKPD